MDISNIKRIQIPEGVVAKIEIGGTIYFQAQLDTPTNISVSGAIATCDEVEFASTYEYYIDDVLLGEYIPNSN